MNELISLLEKSIVDQFFSKSEIKVLKELLLQNNLGKHEIISLRRKVFSVANEVIRPENYQLVMKWVEEVNKTVDSAESVLEQVHFSPGNSCREAIIKHLNSASQHIRICVFTISDNIIVDAILKAHRKGIKIKIITDNDKTFDRGSDIKELAEEGVLVKIDQTSSHMHHKFMVVDNSIAITGSYNWTRSAAEHNHENIVVLQEDSIIDSYSNEFDKLWLQMKEY